MSDETIEIETKGLDQVIKALKKSPPVAKVGVIGKKAAAKHSKSKSNNATIGAKHEFGEPGKLPIRSFLRMPLTTQLGKFLEKSGAFDKDSMKKIISEASLMEWMKKVAAIAENVVAEAFATGGFGKWKPSNMKYKKVKMTLVETQQLRNSISSEVKE